MSQLPPSSAVASIWTRVYKLFDSLVVSDSNGWFATPVDAKLLGLANYDEVIRTPMDFATITRKREAGLYRDINALAEDVHRVFDNAIKFNPSAHPVHKEALRIKAIFSAKFPQLQELWDEKTGQGQGGGKKRKTMTATAAVVDALPSIPLTDANRPSFVAVIGDLLAWDKSELFRFPVKREELPAYFDVISQPMDLTSVKMKLWGKMFTTTGELDTAMQLIHDNACTFNAGKEGGPIRKDAKDLLKRWRDKLKGIIKGASSGSTPAAAGVDDAATDSEDEEEVATARAAAAAKKAKTSEKTPKAAAKQPAAKQPAAASSAAAKQPASSAAPAATSGSSSYYPALSALFTKFLGQLKRSHLDIFEFPVPQALFPDYYELIARPICLDDVRQTLEAQHGYDRAPEKMLSDVALIWENCRTFNEEGSGPYVLADTCQRIWEKVLSENKELKTLNESSKGKDKTKKTATAAATSTPVKAAAPIKDETPTKPVVKIEKVEKAALPASVKTESKKKPTAPTPPAAAAAASSSGTSSPPPPPDVFSAKQCRQVLGRLTRDKDRLAIFMAPVDESLAKDYSRWVKTPMCINQVHENIVKSKYVTNAEFARDVELIWKNCVTYNTPQSELGKLALRLRAEFRQLYATEFGTPTPGADAKSEKKKEKVVELSAEDKKREALERELRELTESVAAFKAKQEAEAAAVAAPPPPPAVVTPPKAPQPAPERIKTPTPTSRAASPAPPAAVRTPATTTPAATPVPAAATSASLAKAPSPSPPAASPTPSSSASATAAPPAAAPSKLAAPAPASTAAPPVAAAASTAATAATPSAAPSVPVGGLPPTTAALALAAQLASPFYTAELDAKLAQPIDIMKVDRVLNRLSRDTSLGPFRTPVVVDSHIKDYPIVCPDPMDLFTLKANLTRRAYTTFKEFTNDLERIWANAIHYNGLAHAVSKSAATFREKSRKNILEMFKETPAPGEASAVKKGLPEAVAKRVKDLLTGLIKSTSYGHGFVQAIETTMDDYSVYAAQISQPMDLGKVTAKLTRGDYTTLDDFYADVRLTFTNALTFHGAQSFYGLQAQFMLNEFEWRVRELEYALAKAANQFAGKKGGPKGHAIPPLALLRKTTAGGTVTSVPQTPAVDAGGDTPMPDSVPGETPQSVTVGDGTMSFPPITLTPEDEKKCHSVIDKLLADVRLHAFSSPVDPSLYGLSNYFEVVKMPMDLRLIKRKLAMRAYTSTDEVVADVRTISSNVALFYCGGASSAVSDAASIVAGAELLQQTFDSLWKNYSTIKQPKIKQLAQGFPMILQAQTQQPQAQASNLAPPTLAPQAVPPVKIEGGAPSALPYALPPGAAAAGLPFGGRTAEEHAARLARKEQKRMKKEKKEAKKRKRAESAGQIDVAGDSGPNTPNSLPEIKTEYPPPIDLGPQAQAQAHPPPPRVVFVAPPTVAPTSTMLAPTTPFTLPTPQMAASMAMAAPRLKIPKHSASSSSSSLLIEPKKLAAGPTPLQPRIVFKSGPTPPPQRKPVAPQRVISFAQRRHAMEVAKAKQAGLETPTLFASALAAAVTQQSPQPMDIDSGADSSSLPLSTPALAALPSTLSVAAVVARMSPPPPLQRAHSSLGAVMTVVDPRGPDGRRVKDKKGRKRAEKWRAHKAACERAQELINLRAKARQATRADRIEKDQRSVEMQVLPVTIAASDVPAYAAHNFFADDSGTLIRVLHTTMPATRLFPYPIDQHVLLFARADDGTSELVDIDLNVNDLAAINLARDADAELFDQWINLKMLADETRDVEQACRSDVGLFQHPLTSSSQFAADLSFFAALAPSLDWRPEVGCYTHAVEFAGDAEALEIATSTSNHLDGDGEERKSASPTPSSPIASASRFARVSYEQLLEMDLHDSSSDDEAATPEAHARPFFGLTTSRCHMQDCHVTPIAGGRFYHRCASRPVGEAPAKRRRLEAPLAMPAPPPASASPPVATQAVVACTGVVIWSLPNTLQLRINGAAYGPSPFEPHSGVWRRLPEYKLASTSGPDLQLCREITMRSRAERKVLQQTLAMYED